ncbi:TadE/TadG family type IV pilus assembly protein [Aestuariivirga sp.]|uniref:TadE/TadG family type IV pilus assembly protein n=1 Tax=Aestuariivirga sp. TaxID=2650926 RepID=UPI0039E6A6BA
MLVRLAKALGQRFRRIKESESGATVVEFAMVAGPFFLVLGCICETGLVLFSEYVLQNSTQEAARLVRTGQVTATDGTIIMSAADFKAKICDTVGILLDCTDDVTVYVNSATNFATLTTSIGDPKDIGPMSTGAKPPIVFTPGGQLKAAAVIATYDWDFVFPFMDFLGNINSDKARRIWGLAIFRNEPF